MSVVIKVVSILMVMITAGNSAYVPAPFSLQNMNIQSVAVSASFYDFLTFNFNSELNLLIGQF